MPRSRRVDQMLSEFLSALAIPAVEPGSSISAFPPNLALRIISKQGL
jgi:hypothetical protein